MQINFRGNEAGLAARVVLELQHKLATDLTGNEKQDKGGRAILIEQSILRGARKLWIFHEDKLLTIKTETDVAKWRTR